MIGPVGPQELDAFVRGSTLVESFAAYSLTTAHLSGRSGVERLTAVSSDLSLFSVLEAPAALGRIFRADDGLDVAVISTALWQRRFGSDPNLPGSTVTLNGRPFTIVGVMPEAFQFPYRAGSMMPGALPETRTDVWIPLPPLQESPTALRRGRMSVIARLKPGVTVEAASGELRVIAGQVEQQLASQARIGVRLQALDDVVVGSIRRSLWILFAAVGLVLVAACANVANLLLARMTVRLREVVTRSALGATPRRLASQFLAESLVLSLLGGILGALVARWSIAVLARIAAARIPRAHEIALDWQAFAFLLCVCVSIAFLFGMAPALAASRVDVQSMTRESGVQTTSAGRFARLRDGLVVLEVALAFVLAAGAATVVREMIRLQRIDNGMAVENVLTLHLTPRAPATDYAAIEAAVAAVPGVAGAGFTQLVPLQNWGWSADFSIKGRVYPERAVAGLRYVTPGYFRTLGIPALRGRTFTDGDDADAAKVIVINETLARKYFPGEDPVGLAMDRGLIVGVVRDVLGVGLDQPAESEIYYPAAQNVTMAPDIGMSLLVRTAGTPDRTAEAIRAAIRGVNPSLAVFNVRTMTQIVTDSLWEVRLYRSLMGAFAALALLLAAIGLHGVIAYNVTSRIREFAVRLALGADPAALTRLVVRRALMLVGTGLAGGLLCALAVTPLLSSLPVGAAAGPLVYAAIVAVLVAVALLASLVPAVRVARVNPANALRAE
jgi:predicted permease